MGSITIDSRAFTCHKLAARILYMPVMVLRLDPMANYSHSNLTEISPSSTRLTITKDGWTKRATLWDRTNLSSQCPWPLEIVQRLDSAIDNSLTTKPGTQPVVSFKMTLACSALMTALSMERALVMMTLSLFRRIVAKLRTWLARE